MPKTKRIKKSNRKKSKGLKFLKRKNSTTRHSKKKNISL